MVKDTGVLLRVRLTRGTDKLIALSGIAKRFQALTNDTYVAGMWQKHLAQQLHWHTNTRSSVVRSGESDAMQSAKATEQEEWRAPSWSRASIDDPTSPSLDTSQSESGLLIRVDGVQIRAVSNDVTGVLKGASLRLQGTLKAVSFRRRLVKPGRLPYWDTYIADQDMHVHFYPDRPGLDLATLSAQHLLFYVPSNLRASSSGPGSTLDSLALQLVDAARAVYRRIGLISAGKPERIATMMALQAEEHAHPCLQYSKKSPHYRHTICLI